MYCKICNRKIIDTMDLLGSNICKDCFEEISTTPVFAEDYDYYKEIVKRILKNYIYKKVILNPVR